MNKLFSLLLTGWIVGSIIGYLVYKNIPDKHHTCLLPDCPYHGILPAQYKQYLNWYSGDGIVYRIDSIHLAHPYYTNKQLRNMAR